LLFEGKGLPADAMLGYMRSNLALVQMSGEERTAAEKQRDYIAAKSAPDQFDQSAADGPRVQARATIDSELWTTITKRTALFGASSRDET